MNKQDKVYKALEVAYEVSLDQKNARIEDIRAFRKEIVHNTRR